MFLLMRIYGENRGEIKNKVVANEKQVKTKEINLKIEERTE